MAKYSVSQIQVYLQCPLKYRYRYVDKIPTPEFVETTDTLLWTLVHESLQNLYNNINIFKIPTKEEFISSYYNLRTKKEKETAENWWEILNHHTDLSIDDFKRRWEAYLSKYYDKHSPFDDLQVISTEKLISFQLDEWINFQWYIDRLDKSWDTFIINDYKTGKNLPSEEEKDQYIEQLTLYWLWIQQKYLKYFKNLKAKLYFLHFDIEDERDITQEKLDEIKNKYLNIIREIEKNKVQYAMWSKKIFEATQSPLCTWCDYQSICPLFNAINSDDEVEWELSDKSITTLVDEFIEISDKISELEKQKEWIKGIFQKYVIKKDPHDEKSDYLLSGTTQDVKITKSPKMNVIDKDKFIQKIKDLWLFEEYADISRQNVNNLFLKSWKVRLSDFMWAVEQDITFSMRKQNKK
jgi:putative RecB family exonuclease